MKYLHRIHVLPFFLVTTLLFFVTGCGEEDSQSAQSGITLHVLGEDYSPMQGLEKMAPKFTEETGIEVRIARFDAETARKKYLSEFQAGATNYDVVMAAFYDLGLLVANRWVLNFDEVLADPKRRDPKLRMEEFSDAILDLTSRYQGELYGLPCSAQSMFLWYRKDLFASAKEQAAFKESYGYELPQPTVESSMTWKQYRDVAKFFTRPKGFTAAGEKLEQPLYGTVLQAKNHRALWFEFQNYLYGMGGAWIASNAKTAVADSEESIAALAYYVGLMPFAPPGALNYTWDEALTLFQNGQAAMGVMWSDSIAAVEDSTASRVTGKIGYAANPVRNAEDKPVSAFGGWGLFVNANSKHPDAAARFVQWANRPDIQLAWAKVGGIPATLSTYADPEYAALPGSPAHAASLDNLATWSTAPYSPRLIDVGQNLLARGMASELTPDETMSRITARFQSIIEEHAK
uniref:ABC-type glycerol-3-phosphate transport system, substrate-binding protein n=1 Tax=Candidatus Kentrum sp. SD TaxID=2126332 RepID=A0A451BMN8_9GAMM|nr:MAG: ABC-type glycerol-3-phosphate transport system, substrate-binding protein [Candidatus Kentron sp. SD]VFK45372.1 MAG: ABC-type glycerol-3-phosphate transport system, substrate-binding protein [Candidatus Kentron sp. SD]VFK79533.1 MAG: ABC-type glycerol-3-phosphate transport system, substrate-binding protein [Candidatus Kentron sp. SD]